MQSWVACQKYDCSVLAAWQDFKQLYDMPNPYSPSAPSKPEGPRKSAGDNKQKQACHFYTINGATFYIQTEHVEVHASAHRKVAEAEAVFAQPGGCAAGKWDCKCVPGRACETVQGRA
jgi:hypothetical protein